MVYPDITSFPKFVKGFLEYSVLLPPLGILYIISNVEHKIDFMDNRLHRYSDVHLFEKLKNYDMVGFGGTIAECPQARSVSKLLRRVGIKTMYGGPNATVNWERYIEDFDIIVKGEGELTVNEILNHIAEGKELNDIQGIVFRQDGNTINNPDRGFIPDLDTLKYPARELLDLAKYLREAKPFLDVHPVDTMVSSRGCPFACTFCSSKYFWKRTYRARKPEAVIEEIRYLMDKFGTKGIYFREDLFTVSKERTLEFCKLIKPLGIDWMCESRVDTVDEEMLETMKGAGCKAIDCGIESCSNKTLKLIGKGITLEQAKKTIELCKRIGIFIGGSFMIGFPHETKEDILENLSQAHALGLDYTSVSRLVGIPRSELYETISKEGLDRYEYEGIIIPDTRHVRADVVTAISSYGTYNWKIKIYDMIPPTVRRFVGRIVRWLSPTLPARIERIISK